MADPTNQPNDLSNVKESARAATARVNVCLPATMVSYDETTQTATVKIVPCFRRKDPAQGNAVRCYDPPELHQIPVAFPGANGFGMTWPLTAADTGYVVVSDRSMDEWKSEGGTRTTPQDARRHDLTDAIFVPNIASPAVPRPSTAYDAAAAVIFGATIKLGSSGATQAVALAPLVQTDLTILKTALAAAGAAAVVAAVPADGGVAAFAAFNSSLAASLAAWPSSLGAGKVLAE